MIKGNHVSKGKIDTNNKVFVKRWFWMALFLQTWSWITAMKNVAVLTEDGAFALFFIPQPGGFDSSRVPTPGNLASKAKKCWCPGVSPGWGVWQGAAGIGWCIIRFSPMDFCYVHSNKKWCLKLTELFLVCCYYSPFTSLFTRVPYQMDRIRYLFGSGPSLSTLDRSIRKVCSHGIGLTL